jgi:hypothetical protein
LEEQHNHTVWQRVVESREVKKHLECSQEPLPDLEESNVDSDDDDSLSGSPTFESGGEVVKRDIWGDHPAKQLDFEPVVDPSQPPLCPEETTEGAPAEPELGRSMNGKSHWLQG